MGLAHRVIPVLLFRGDKLVKGIKFNSNRVVGHARQCTEIQNSRQVDELIVLDVEANQRGTGPNLEFIERLTDCCFAPVTVGGGVRNLHDARELLRHGADKVAVSTALVQNPNLAREISWSCGSQALVAAIEAVKIRNHGYCVATHCGGVYWPGLGVVEHAKHVAALGAGEILLTSVDMDGTLAGYDVPLIREVASAIDVPLIASGGAGTYHHMLAAIRAGADAVAAGAMFQWTSATPREAAEFLQANGIETRIP